MGSRMSWAQIREHEDFRGRWVALDDCRYDGRSARPVEGEVIDVDDDLVTLCTRIQENDERRCAILFCDDDEPAPPASAPPTVLYARTVQAMPVASRRR